MAGKSPTSPFCFARCSALFFFLFVSFFAFALGVSGESTKSIHPTGYVTDLAGVIHADTKARLESLCTELQQKTGAQMAIVTVQSLEGRSIEEYAVDLYKQLGVVESRTIAVCCCCSRPTNTNIASKSAMA